MAKTDPLALYNKKRDFSKTTEPAGRIEPEGGNRFIVQKHAASRLHYDFRLEMDGVLKSWAVTRGPSLNTEDKRLAVRTEDHPVSYASFEGCIPEEEYGGGTVMLWDEGLWAPIDNSKKPSLDRGKLHFRLEGKRMRGEWLLVRMRGKGNEKRENWLLRKLDDEHAGGSDDLIARELTSIKTGRSMNEIASDGDGEFSLEGKKGKAFEEEMKKAERHSEETSKKKPGSKQSARKSGKRRKLPRFRAPQLATLVDEIPEGNNWLHEIKYDGYRCLMALTGERAKLYSRSGKDWSDKFTGIAEEATTLSLDSALIDGEVVKLDADGNPSFSALQQALGEDSGGLMLFAFDLLELDGEDLSDLPTLERKERLGALLANRSGSIRFAEHLVGAGEQLLETLCKAGQEGIISKRADAPYRGKRSRNWLKIKCSRRQEFVIIGWRKSDKKGRAFASLLLAQYEGEDLIYKGRVGTGFSAESMEAMAARMEKITRKTAPAEVPSSDSRDVTWVTPKLVAEIAFAEFTADTRVRHASFVGLREDKEASEVRPENAAEVAQAAPKAASTDIRISNADRVIFPNAGISKGQLAHYYEGIAPLILPWLSQRPVSLLRCPRGRAKQCFFQKHAPGSFGKHVLAVPIEEKDGGVEDYLYVDSAAGIVACVQMGSIEFHGWGSQIETLEQPDRLVFDLDPDEGLDFTDVKKAAQQIRGTLADLGLVSFAMLSGGKGVHVVAPLTPDADWPVVKDFARRFATAMAQAQPEQFTATLSKAKRKSKIFIDWLRNQRGATSVAPYSARAREGAPVACPITWEELRDLKRPAVYGVKDMNKLLERANRAGLRGWGQARQRLPEA